MYPQVVQFETRRHQIDSELQLIRERNQGQTSDGDALLERSTQAHAGERAPREQGVSAFLLTIAEFLTGHQRHPARFGDPEAGRGTWIAAGLRDPQSSAQTARPQDRLR